MKVLWFAMTSSCYDIKNTGSWIEALEKIFKRYIPDTELGIAFEHEDDIFKVKRDGVVYYPINIKRSNSPKQNYFKLEPAYIKIIEDFHPDIIQCFGTERWHYGLIAKKVNVPVVIHMMGFMNIYDMMDETVIHHLDYWKYFSYNPLKVWINRKSWNIKRENQELEKKVMLANHFFMGRTEWDKNIVKYYSPQSTYFHCPEAIREEIYNSQNIWRYHKREKLKLITIGNAGSLKGNEIMLKTAQLLKEDFHIDFEWIYTSDPYKMSFFEKLNNINCEDVNIKLIGRIDASRIAKELSEADLYIHPSIIDNSPNTVCEAQLIGIPVIAANTGGLAQMIEDGKTGFLYPYSEPHTLAFTIMNLYRDKEKLEMISSNEIDMSHKRHDPQSVGNQLVKIYKTIIDNYNNFKY